MTHAIMSNTDYKGICDTVRAKTGTTALLKSAEVAPAIRSIELSTTSLTLTITTEAGATVTATKGSLSVTAVATNGTAVLKLKEAGEWTVTASLGGETSVVLVSVTDSYEISLSYIDPVFANNSWEAIIKACQKRKVPESWKVADQKPMLINGTEYLIDIIGKDHDEYSDGSGKAPLTLQMHDCYATGYSMKSSSNNSGGWAKSTMRNTHLPALLALMPEEVQTAIKEVNKVSGVGGTINAVETVADRLFLLSEWEVFGKQTYAAAAESIQTQYAYYLAGNSKKKNRGNTAVMWWERSPYDSSTARWCCVRETGAVYYATSLTAGYGVAPAFCF